MIHRLSYIFLIMISATCAAGALLHILQSERIDFPTALQLVTAVLTISCVFLIKSRETAGKAEAYLSARLTVFIIVYATLLPFFGYLLSTTIFVYLITRDYSINWTDCLLASLISSLVIYTVFEYGFNFSPPLGKLFIILGGNLW